ncbi:MAG: hypothetical protein J7J57_03305 [Caldisericaceae bacterium]|nr:hypothetical protein [Caldisericaceae bacterium]RLD18507.1 MAG: hypothetical protein DRI33_04170 [Caldisericota bacterium]
MKIKIALAQINPLLGDIEKNREKHLEFIEKAIENNAQIIVFPELSITGYRLKDFTMEVALPANSNFFNPILKQSKKIDIAFGFVERGKDNNIYNSAMYIENQSIKSVYQKIYLPTHGMFQELRFMGKGEKITTFKTIYGNFSMLICRDLFHPSLLFLTYAQKTDVVLGMSGMPLRGVTGKKPAIQETVEKAIDTYTNFFSQFIVFVNRVGFEDGLGFYGGSFVGTPLGKKLAFAGILQEKLTFATIDLEEIYKKRQLFPLAREEDLNIVQDNLRRILEENYGKF